eukprot:scaffold10494_cov53-Phaeocystis_antarctica.AAC.2
MSVVDAAIVVLARGQPDDGWIEQPQGRVWPKPPKLQAGEYDALVAEATPRSLLRLERADDRREDGVAKKDTRAVVGSAATRAFTAARAANALRVAHATRHRFPLWDANAREPPPVSKQAGSDLGQLALRRLLSAPDNAPASANEPLSPRWPATQTLLSTGGLALQSCSSARSRASAQAPPSREAAPPATAAAAGSPARRVPAPPAAHGRGTWQRCHSRRDPCS